MSHWPSGYHNFDTCHAACIAYRYMALQAGTQCFCENDWNLVTQYGPSSCGTTGGYWCNYVYDCIESPPSPPSLPAPERQLSCRSSGDPHFSTFGGSRYDFMGRGPFSLVALNESGWFGHLEIQTYQCPSTFNAATGNAMVAISLGGGVAALFARDSSVITTTDGSFDGPNATTYTLTQVASSPVSLGSEGAVLENQPMSRAPTWRVRFAHGGSLLAQNVRGGGWAERMASGNYWNVWVSLPQSATQGASGLCSAPCSFTSAAAAAQTCDNSACLMLSADRMLFSQGSPSDINSHSHMSTLCSVPPSPPPSCPTSSVAGICSTTTPLLPPGDTRTLHQAAEAECAPLKPTLGDTSTSWYDDCLFDFCAFGGNFSVLSDYQDLITDDTSATSNLGP